MKIVLYLSIFLIALTIQGQQKPKESTQVTKVGAYPDKDLVVYRNAVSLGDLESVTYALHNIIAANPNGAIYKDTLALVYLQRDYYRQAQSLAKLLYQEKQNEVRTEILAICAKQLGQSTEAIDFYKNLYNSTKKVTYAFEQLQLEYSIKRLAEAKITAEALLTAIPSDEKTKLTVPKLDSKTVQEISLKAGLYYLLGNIYFDLNDKTNAQIQFEKSIELQPDYELAKNALHFLTKKEDADAKKQRKLKI